MSLYGALAENTRRNERCERGSLVIPVGNNGVGYITVDPRVNASITKIIAPAYGGVGGMRFMTHFELTVDDLGVPGDGLTVTKPIDVTGSINSTTKTINSIVYAIGTVLTVNLYVATSVTNPTAIQTGVGGSVRYTIWGALANSVADPEF